MTLTFERIVFFAQMVRKCRAEADRLPHSGLKRYKQSLARAYEKAIINEARAIELDNAAKAVFTTGD